MYLSQSRPANQPVAPLSPTHLPPILPDTNQQQGYTPAQREQLWKRIRIANTQRLYKQNRFNLLSEESEGYCKVGQ